MAGDGTHEQALQSAPAAAAHDDEVEFFLKRQGYQFIPRIAGAENGFMGYTLREERFRFFQNDGAGVLLRRVI